MSEEFDVQLLETKKKKFIEVVNRICEKRNLPIPYVNFDGCPAENGDQLAHYHSDVNMICISKRQLTVLNFDNLEEVAAHEVAHILEQNHGDKFSKEENINKMLAWKPSGVVIIDGNQKVERLSKEAMEKIEKVLTEIQMEEERKKYPLMPEPEIEQEGHILTPDEIIKLTGSHEPVKKEIEDFDKVHVTPEIVNKSEKKNEDSREERTKRMREELKGKLEGTYNDIQNVDLTNIPKEELMPEDLSPEEVIKEANELRNLYSPKLRFRLLRGIKRIVSLWY